MGVTVQAYVYLIHLCLERHTTQDVLCGENISSLLDSTCCESGPPYYTGNSTSDSRYGR